MGELKALNLDSIFTGFEPREIDEFLVSKTETDEADANQAPAVPTEPVSRPGDLWRCGPHRVMHGDATNREHVARALGDLRPLLMTVDASYGVELDPMWRKEAGLGAAVQTGLHAGPVAGLHMDEATFRPESRRVPVAA
jgi:hypothetical protein